MRKTELSPDTDNERSANGADGDSALPRAVTVVFRVLEAVAAAPGAGVSALARDLDIAKSTVQRALRTLEALGYVYSSGEITRWYLTLRTYTLGSRAPVVDLAPLALTEMRELSAVTNESVQLLALEGDSVLVIEKIDSTQAVRSYVGRGERLPAHVSASGKALLASSPYVLEEMLRRPLHGYTEGTITDPERFRAQIAEIREQGYALNDGEYRSDVSAIGAVVFGGAGDAIAAIGISAPRHRASPERLREMAPALLAATGRLSRSAQLDMRDSGNGS
ncbi:DNA-binding transcriptional regulator KdgR [Pseudonocardia ailaonensis]|uniref:DNA-binding transcriptional regulator KdgR n=2 Tax=Pseudonocardia ailaonensis TaxID=367279 RepID=A0ABN2N7R8_9PSEU